MASPQRYARLAIAIVVAALVIAAGILASSYVGNTTTVVKTTTLTTTELCQQQLGNSTEGYIADCLTNITLSLGIQSTALSSGENETFYLSLKNDLPINNTQGIESVPALPPGGLPHLNLSAPGPADYVLPFTTCGPTVPAWIAIYNDSSGLPMQLNDDHYAKVVVCGTTTIGIPYEFAPNQTLAETLSVGGFWHSSNATAPWEDASFARLSAGSYTVDAFDAWTQLISLNFTVTQSAA